MFIGIFQFDIKENIVALTKKNASFVNAILRIDPDYKDNTDILKNSIENLKKKYDVKNLKDFLKMINNTNRTRLSDLEIDKKVEIILGRCRTMSHLEKEIMEKLEKRDNSKFDSQNRNLFYELCEPFKANEDNKNGTIRISFASKFYFYTRKFLLDDCKFSKYDSFVASNLSKYEEVYCGSASKSTYVIKGSSKIELAQKQDKYYDAYIEYMNAIEKILKKTKKINQEEFDMIVWYTTKNPSLIKVF